jgi:3-hydroxybutyryl-CoA dehydrogenase
MVELALGLNSAETALNRAKIFWESIGMTPVVVKDGAGLVRARVVCCIINEAVTALQEGVATAQDIDQAMQLGTNYPHGPLHWADYLGIDFVLGVMQGLYDEWQEDRYRPAPLLRQMVLAGRIGRKTSRGFYDYND